VLNGSPCDSRRKRYDGGSVIESGAFGTSALGSVVWPVSATIRKTRVSAPADPAATARVRSAAARRRAHRFILLPG
jgi:hypothetical protein